jgi:hypothetical protein
MRIVHVVGASPVKESIRGDQRHVLYLATAQQARGLSVAVMTDGEGLFTEACERQGGMAGTGLEQACAVYRTGLPILV